MLDEKAEPVRAAIEDARARVFEHLDGKHCKQEFSSKYVNKFEELRQKAESCNNLADLQSVTVEADALKVRCLNEIDSRENAILKEIAEKQAKAVEQKGGSVPDTPPTPKPVIKKRRSISIKSINTSGSWQLESEEDVKKYVAELEKKLIQTLEDDTIINIEF